MPSDRFPTPTPIQKEEPASPISSVGDSVAKANPVAASRLEAVAQVIKSVDDLCTEAARLDQEKGKDYSLYSKSHDLSENTIASLESRDPASMNLRDILQAVDLSQNVMLIVKRHGAYNGLKKVADQFKRYDAELERKMDQAVTEGRGKKQKSLSRVEADKLKSENYGFISSNSSTSDYWIFNPGTPEVETLKELGYLD